MNAMEKMVLSMLQGLIPPEVLASINKENIEKIVTSAQELRDTIIQGLQSIQDEQASQRAMLEELINDLDGNSGKPGGGTASLNTDGPGTGKSKSK